MQYLCLLVGEHSTIVSVNKNGKFVCNLYFSIEFIIIKIL